MQVGRSAGEKGGLGRTCESLPANAWLGEKHPPTQSCLWPSTSEPPPARLVPGEMVGCTPPLCGLRSETLPWSERQNGVCSTPSKNRRMLPSDWRHVTATWCHSLSCIAVRRQSLW